jgi:hypothetical protein
MKTWQFRHVLGWAFVLLLIFTVAIDTTTIAAHGDVEMLAWLLWLLLLVVVSAAVYHVRTLRNWEQLGAAQTVSRTLLISPSYSASWPLGCLKPAGGGSTSRPAAR